ncbi:MAG: hypothetical protein H0U28_16165 [Nocardioidaceae bacterium]|nr:hypothetical protein [Nocardioidaceae bacterium]
MMKRIFNKAPVVDGTAQGGHTIRMPDRVLVHIGAPKTGTTFLQAVLFHNRERLGEHGVLVPGKNRLDHGRAATGVRKGPGSKAYRQWRRIVSQARDWAGTVVISNEWFAMASAEQARRAMEELAGVETHLLFTARDLVEQVPAAWQETLKLGVASSLDEFVHSLDTDEGRWRWSVLDPAPVLDTWRGDLPPEHVHVVTVPPKGSDSALLWKRFAQVCGIDPDSCQTELDQARESVGVESAQLLQRAGPLLRAAIEADAGHWSEPYRWIQRYLSHQLLVPRGGSRIALRPGDFDFLRARSMASVDVLKSRGYDVAGDLADLTSAEPSSAARHPDDVTDSELLDLALPLIADLLGRVRAEVLRADEAEERNVRASDVIG